MNTYHDLRRGIYVNPRPLQQPPPGVGMLVRVGRVGNGASQYAQLGALSDLYQVKAKQYADAGVYGQHCQQLHEWFRQSCEQIFK